MKCLTSPLALTVLLHVVQLHFAFGQGTAFTYQGVLNVSNTPATGTFDLRLSVHDAASGGFAFDVTNAFDDVNITNGLFTVVLDPGAAVFNGSSRWLEIGVRPGTNNGAFTLLSPRQAIKPAPMAIFAGNATIASTVSSNASLTNVIVTGTFTGNGGALTNLEGGNIVPGSISSSAIAGGQVVKNLNGLTDAVQIESGNNIFLTTNGNTLTVLTAPGLLSWIPTSSTAQTAAVNKGYLMTNNTLATVTLPATPALADIIRVSGSGTAGWKIAQNADQSIRIKSLPGNIGVNWFARENNRAWSAVASSEDGLKLVAVVNGGQIYTSNNGGTNWTARDSNRGWSAAASSADGIKLFATVNGGKVYTSTNSGASWTPRENNRSWISVASSSDGNTLIAGVSGDLNYVSFNSGVSWATYPIASGGKLALSADGLKAVVVVNGGQIYTSPNSGITWTPRDSNRNWSSVASSADGIKLVATVNGGQIYTSTDYGVTWTPRDGNRSWTGVASSADGTRLVATVSGGQIYTSIDSGITWTARDSNRGWTGVASSASGDRIAATVSTGQIYSSDNLNPVTTSGAAGYLLGEQYSAIELQYVGNNQFIPLSHEGFIGGF